jgi:hypothetical protein
MKLASFDGLRALAPGAFRRRVRRATRSVLRG